MKKLLLGFIATSIALSTLAQTDIFKKKRSYKVEGYIVLGIDTINGTIAIPITDDELDYHSLATSVTFIDSLNKTQKYTPRKATGFGLRGDAVFGEYVSISMSEGLDKDLFLKRVLNGKIILFEYKLDRTVIKSYPSTFRGGPKEIRKKESVNESIYYLKKGSEPLLKVQFNPKTLTIKKKDLKKLIDVLPDDFSNSEEEIDESELITILSDYNSPVSKE